MFLFADLTPMLVLAWFAVLGGLILANELLRRSMWLNVVVFVAFPLIMSVAVWPNTAVEGTTEGSWFAWAKLYTILAFSIFLIFVRFKDGFADLKFVKPTVALLLAVNILEACWREFEIADVNGIVDGMYRMGGAWNYFNSAAGILNIIAICGWAGVFIGGKHKDMLWPDMLLVWIIGYDLWNFTFVYNVLPDQAYYTGAALIIAATVPAFIGGRGAWLQHRVYTLTLLVMINFTFVEWEMTSALAVKTTNSAAAMWTLSLVSFFFNLGLVIYQARRIFSRRLNPLKDELYTDTAEYRETAAKRALTA